MANSRLDAKLAKKRAMDRCKKLGIRDRWYYVFILPDKPVQIIAEPTPLKEVLNTIFSVEHEILKMGNQSVYLISEPKTEKAQPTLVYAGNNLYGAVRIVAMVDGVVDLLPFTSVISALDALWFPQDAVTDVQIVL